MSERPTFSVDVVPAAAGGRTRVVVAGEVDIATADELGRAARDALAAGPVLLDLSAVTFLDSSGIRLLNGLLEDREQRDADLLIDPRLQDSVAQVLRLTGMLDGLPLAVEEGGAGR